MSKKELAHQMMMSYVEARRSRVPVAELGKVERAGMSLLFSARGTRDGEPDVGDAIARSLLAGDVDAAVEISDALMDIPAPVFGRRCNGNFRTSGRIGF